MQQLIETISSVGVSVHELAEKMGLPVIQHKDMAGPLATFKMNADGTVIQLQKLQKELPNNSCIGVESYTTGTMFTYEEERKPNLNKNGPVRDPHRRHGRG